MAVVYTSCELYLKYLYHVMGNNEVSWKSGSDVLQLSLVSSWFLYFCLYAIVLMGQSYHPSGGEIDTVTPVLCSQNSTFVTFHFHENFSFTEAIVWFAFFDEMSWNSVKSRMQTLQTLKHLNFRNRPRQFCYYMLRNVTCHWEAQSVFEY